MAGDRPDARTDAAPDASRGQRLDSWKEIAAYLKRDVATARRWEKRESLPIHRHQHEKLSSVYAYTSELDAWVEGRGQVEPRQGHWIKRPQAVAIAIATVILALIAVISYRTRASDAPGIGAPRIRLAVHRPGTVASLIATGLHDVLRDALPDVAIEAVDQPGMLSTIRGIDSGQLDLGLAFNLVAFHAVKTEELLGHRSGRIIALTVAYPNPAQVIVRRDGEVRTIADLRGKRVSLGIAEAGGRFCSEILLAHFGLRSIDIVDHFTDAAPSLEQLRDRRIDAIIDWRGLPSADQVRAFQSGELRLVPLELPSVEGLRVKNPFLVPWTIPARVFPHQDTPVSTVSARMLLLASRSLPADTTERILEAIARRMPDLIAHHPAAAEINVKKRPTLEDGLSIDLHQGAERYFQAVATR